MKPVSNLRRLEILVLEDPLEERNRRADAAHLVFGEGAAHALNGVLARVAPRDQLRDHRIVEDRHLAAFVGAAVVAHAGPLRHAQPLDAPRRRQEAVVGILRVDAAFDRVRLRVEQRFGIEIEALASRDANLPLHQVDAGHHLGDRMLDLQARVHLEEVERAVLVEQELDRAGVGVAHRLRDRRRGRRHAPPQLRRDRERRALFDDLLVAPLDRALALDERQHGAVMIAEQLHFDVARRHDAALEIDRAVAECRLRLGSRGAKRARQIGGRRDHAHALAAAAGHRFQHQRIADALGDLPDLVIGALDRSAALRCRARPARRP